MNDGVLFTHACQYSLWETCAPPTNCECDVEIHKEIAAANTRAHFARKRHEGSCANLCKHPPIERKEFLPHARDLVVGVLYMEYDFSVEGLT